MQDGTETLETFLTAAPEGTPILITGHSLGGCPASVLAPCVANWVGNTSSLSVYTIAAPSPGNEDFASYYNALFNQSGHSTAFRFFSSLDVVPNAWESLNTVETYYPLWSVPPTSIKSLTAPKMPWVGSIVSLGSLRRVAQSKYPARSSRWLVRIEAAWGSILSRMRFFCGRLLNNTPARHTRRCCRRL